MQVQCQNADCGSYNTHHKKTTFVLPNGKESPGSQIVWYTLGIIGIPFALAYLWITDYRDWGVDILGTFLAIVMVSLFIILRRYTLTLPRYDTYECWTCHYEWTIPSVPPVVTPAPPQTRKPNPLQSFIGGFIGGALIGSFVCAIGGIGGGGLVGGLIGFAVGGIGGGLIMVFYYRWS